MGTKPNSLKRAVALIAAACTLGTCCIAGSIAWAVDPSGTPAQGENTANIKAKQPTSITIYKYEGPEGSVRNNGKEQTIPAKQKPISGVKFKITRIVKKGTGDTTTPIDLSNTEGWKAIKDLTVENKTAAQALEDAGLTTSTETKEDETKACKASDTNCVAGSVKFDLGTTYGLYLVEEDLAASKPMKEGNPIKITKQVNPFLVTVPLPNTTTHEWIYNVNIYPKNDVSTNKVEKKAQATPSQLFIASKQSDAKTTMGWDISIPLTAIKDGGDKYTNVSFTDPINTDFLNYSKVENVKVVSKDGTKSENINAGEYEVEAYSSIGESPTKVDLTKSDVNLSTVKWIRVKLVGEGLTKASAKVGGKLTATVVTTVINPGNIKNFINTDVDGVATGEGDKTPGCVPTKDNPCEDPDHPHEGEDTTNFATLTIDKIGLSEEETKEGKTTSKDNGKPLEGAVFKVYKAVDGKQLTDLDGKKVSDVNAINSKGLVDDAKEVREMAPTGKDGKTSDSFFVGNGDKTSHIYCAVETKAPDGFNLDDTLHCKNLTAGDDKVKDNTMTINNKQSNALDKILAALPMTGARGLVILTVCGIVGIAGTFFYIVMKRRKEQEAE